MERSHNQPDPQINSDPENSLRRMTEDLQSIHQGLLQSLQRDVEGLREEKIRLTGEIQKLQLQKEKVLQEGLLQEQQVLMRQLVSVLANHVSSQVESSLEKIIPDALAAAQLGEGKTTETENNQINKPLAATLQQLQTEIEQFQSNLTQQLSRMYTQQEQGEEIIAGLVSRLRQELANNNSTSRLDLEEATQIEFEEAKPQSATIIGEDDVETVRPAEKWFEKEEKEQRKVCGEGFLPQNFSRQGGGSKGDNLYGNSTPGSVIPSPPEPIRRTPTSSHPIASLLLILVTMVSALSNVAIKTIFQPNSQILGVFTVEQLLPPTLENSLLILMLRMLVVVPMMILLAPIMHPRVWQDIKELFSATKQPINPRNVGAERLLSKRVLFLSVFSGLFLFLSQVLIYFAIGQVPTGIAIALFFVYPVIAAFLSWLLFRKQSHNERFSIFRLSAMALIGFGELLILSFPIAAGTVNFSMGTSSAIFAGASFALYLILGRICATRLHPVSATLIHSTTMLLLSGISLIVLSPANWLQNLSAVKWWEIILSGFILGVFTLFISVFNNLGVRKFGATRSAIIGASVPVITFILAGIIIQETLQLNQIIGILIVTVGAVALSLDQIRNRFKTSQESTSSQ
jgi:drug/metabolite transporter (DMT)-like permease